MAVSKSYQYFLLSTPAPYVVHVEINRPQKLNAFIEAMWLEMKEIFDSLSFDSSVRAIVLSGTGPRAFTAGLDVQAATSGSPLFAKDNVDVARKAVAIKRHVAEFQDCISSIEKCEKPVICAMHGFAFGLAIDIATCADVRLSSKDVNFAVKEVDIGIAADIGTLSRLPKVVGSFSWVKDVCLSARVFGADEAYRVGFVSQVLDSKEKAIEKAIEIAGMMASKSPVAVQGTKELLNHARENKTSDSLRYTGVWNSAAIQTGDVEKAMLSGLKRTKPIFEKL